MKKLLLVCMLLVMPVMAQADEAVWKEIGATDTKGNRVVWYNIETLELDSGLECVAISTGFSKYGVSTWGGGASCNYQLYNCLYHGIGCGSGGTEIHNGADVNIERGKPN